MWLPKHYYFGQKQSFFSRSYGKYASFLILSFCLEILVFCLAIYFEMDSNITFRGSLQKSV